ncbi:MAG: ATP-binding protein [Candidatus Ozemobacteraceae bacterium]
MKSIIGRLIGDTGDPAKLQAVLTSSFSARRGEFVKLSHCEQEEDGQVFVLARIVALSRRNVLYSTSVGESASDLELMPGARLTGENNNATLEAIGFRDPRTDQIKMPRRPLDPGSKVEKVDFQFLSAFYQFSEHTSMHLGNLVGYDRGPNVVPVFLDINTLATEHLAVLAMTGAGKSYTVGRIIERLVGLHNGTVVVFDPHGEYGRAFEHGNLQFAPFSDVIEDPRDAQTLPKIRERLKKLQTEDAGVVVYTPQDPEFRAKYAGKNRELALQLDHFHLEDIVEILPELTEPQQRVLYIALRYWIHHEHEPRDINRLRSLLGDEFETLRNWEALSDGERNALTERSANIACAKMSQVINEAQSFYSASLSHPTNIKEMVGKITQKKGRLVIIDLQGLSDNAKQVITALLSSEILRAAASKTDRIRPTFLVYEEGHTFAPAGKPSISHRIIKKIAGEGRKFGVGFAIISQRPSKLDPDVTSQCNTLIVMRLKNPEDKSFISRTSDMVSKAEIEELSSLSTGEALVFGRSIVAPLLVKIGPKALIHGGKSPEVLDIWGNAGD